MGVGAGLYMCDVVKKFTFAISSPDEFLSDSTVLTDLRRVDAVRLVGSGVNYKGRLEVNYNGYWGTVCGAFFGNNDAAVACYMLGFGYVHLKVNCLSSTLVIINYRHKFGHITFIVHYS